MATSGVGLAITAGIYAGVALLIFILFSVWRRLALTRRFYAPKRYFQAPGRARPPRLPATLWGWVPAVAAASEATVLGTAGVDAAVYLKTLRCGLEVFAFASVVALAAALPTNLSGDEVQSLIDEADADPESDGYTFTDLDKLTMSNISSRSKLLYVHAFAAWAITLFVLWQLARYSREALRLRIFHLLNAPAGGASHTVLVTDVPGVPHGTLTQRLDGTALKLVPKSLKKKALGRLERAREAADAGAAVRAAGGDGAYISPKAVATPNAAAASTFATHVGAAGGRWEAPDPWAAACDALGAGASVHALVEGTFTDVYGGEFSHAHMVYDTAGTGLDDLLAAYDAARSAAIDLLDDYEARARRGAELPPKKVLVVGAKMGKWGRDTYGLKPRKEDALAFYTARLTELRRAIGEAQAAAHAAPWPTAFVTFRERRAQVAAAGALMSEDLTAWRCAPAPAPEEVVWRNLGLRAWERAARTSLMTGAFVALTLFFMIPVVAVQGLLSTNSLVSWIDNIQIVNAILTGVLPGLALKIFLALVPMIITKMNRFAGMTSLSQIDMSLNAKFFWFQVVTVFFMSFIAGSLLNQLQQFIDDPASIITVLGTAAPQTAIFFTTYVLLEALGSRPVDLMRVVPLVLFWLKSRLAGTERAKARLWRDQTFSAGALAVDDTIAALLGLSFAVVCPIIAPACLLYFGVTYLVRKHDFLYVFGEDYQSGGMLWPRARDQYVAGLVVMQAVLAALLAIKETVAPPIIIAAAIPVTLAYAKRAHAAYDRPMAALALISAAELDAREAAAAGAAGALGGRPSVAGAPARAATAGDLDAGANLYLSPAFKVDDAAHAAVLAELALAADVLAGRAPAEALAAAAAEELESAASGSVAGSQDPSRAATGADEAADEAGAGGKGFETPVGAGGADDTFVDAAARV